MTAGSLTVRGVEIGAGRPAIIVPLTSAGPDELLDDAAALAGRPVDLVEWRIDRFATDVTDLGAYRAAVLDGARRVRSVLDAAAPEGPGMPLLLTLRTAAEGGARALADDDYRDLLAALCAARVADLIDVEAFRDEHAVRTIVSAAHAAGVLVVASNHDFEATPEEEEIVARLRRMQELGADIAKLAAMPRDPADVLTLLRATWTMHSRHATGPVITMSMGPLGAVSRVSGATFGSAATFGTVGAASAPGQIDVDALAAALDALQP
ncbi:type I 3-dehydroquinate dehydratase [Brachybacterium huguangmaarense]|uniref:3-dehydroquinate dehydratase n=1 Tax=Brachybacterium huguangmaarense TaxID=1652028 RepID=A0ABY6FZP3_9MICO|nr:type I 3-dehydroquinate dehydratase [Brachybacterium huguangmaarense]UYG16416.1 type I 3-dehydroquinate dehydratase [Brachybacterium huguangmaarense]